MSCVKYFKEGIYPYNDIWIIKLICLHAKHISKTTVKKSVRSFNIKF